MRAISANAGNKHKFGAAAIKRIGAFVLALIFAVLMLPDFAEAESSGMLRVWLTRLGTPSTITMRADCAYVLSGDYPMNLPSGTSFSVTASGDSLTFTCDGVSVTAPSGTELLRIGSGTNGIRFISPGLSNVFCGDLILYASGSTIKAVLDIYLETYLYGVVPYEMSNSYPLEALKAQAIVARSYAVKKMGSSGRTYHITDNTGDQVFKGYNAAYALAHQAVNETRGMLLYSGGSVASCYYTASNGGQTESTKNVWGGSLSYSVVKDDPYDLENASSTKKTAIISKNASGLNALLESALIEGVKSDFAAMGADTDSIEITQITAIEALNPKYASPSRLYQTLRFSVSASAKTASGYASLNQSVDVPTYGGIESWYGLSINSSNNETIRVTKNADSFSVTFRRYGHGVGMSQRGAQTMAASYGMSHQDILDFYFPGTSVKTSSFREASGHSASTLPGGAIASAKIASNAVLYDAANGDRIGSITSGKAVSVYEVSGAWARIGISGICAWVQTAYLADFTLAEDPLQALSEAKNAVLCEDAALLELPVETAQHIKTLSVGSGVTVYGKNSAWAYVMTQDGTSGYIAIASLEVGATPEVTPEPTAEITPEPTPEPTAAVTITPEPTSEPTPAPTQEIAMDEPIVTIAPTQTIPVDEPTAAASATATIAPPATPTVTATVAPPLTASPTPSATKGTNALPMQPIPLDATIEPPEAPEGAEDMLVVTEDIYLYIDVRSGSTLTLRSRPTTVSTALAYLDRGAKVKLLAFDDDWACILTENELQGFAAIQYLSESYIQPESAVQPETGSQPEWMRSFKRIDTNVVFCNLSGKTVAAAKLYRSASTSSAVLGTIPAGMQFSVLAYNNEWAYVSRKGISGYVKLKYITLVS